MQKEIKIRAEIKQKTNKQIDEKQPTPMKASSLRKINNIDKPLVKAVVIDKTF